MSKLGVFGSAQATSDRYRRRLLAAAGLSNNLLFSNLNTTITIKSSPPKTARVTSQLGIISGNLTKRNEQHSWQRRFCVLAPQSLLYYFEDAEGDTPRGIIDLEYYTDISAEPNNVVRLATPAHAGPQRTFYFQADSEEDMNAWLSALVRERYFVLRDERDAYQELQHDFQAQTAHMTQIMGKSSEDAEQAAADFERTAREESELVDQLQALLADATLLESESGAAREAQELREHGFEVAELEAELAREEALLRDEAEKKAAILADCDQLDREVDEARMNLGIIAKTRAAADARVAELNDQKKLLVREVKNARKAFAEARAKNSELLKQAMDESAFSMSASEDLADAGDDDASAADAPSPTAAASEPAPKPYPFDASAAGGPKDKASRSFAAAFKSFVADASPKTGKKGTIAKDAQLSSDDEDAAAEPAADVSPAPAPDAPDFVLRCRRCKGTVEGPRNSTCTCAVPLVGDDPKAPSVKDAADAARLEAQRVWKSFSGMSAKSFFGSSSPKGPAKVPAPPPPPEETKVEAPPPAPEPPALPEEEFVFTPLKYHGDDDLPTIAKDPPDQVELEADDAPDLTSL
ncbi:hypothetical protein SO694_00075177 [Aureococcus anophagefferens]|uniref:PH domain-containing protein n=1 Tax=Aureococcus anophagefferens TaxID=44056 RepID=A0ABR1FHE7_AURAN